MKRVSSEALINLLALAVLAALALWLVFSTRWIDVWQRLPPRGEAATDPYYALKRIASRLGAQVSSPDNLDRLPPPGATLVLASQQWDFVPGRVDALRQWVEVQGGHLVLPNSGSVGDGMPWVPIRELPRPRTRSEDKTPPRVPPPPRRPDFVGPVDDPDATCRPYAVRDAAAVSAPPDVRLCSETWSPRLGPTRGAPVAWSIDTPTGSVALRVPVGQGHVTALGAYGLTGNHGVFLGDHARAMMGALDVQPGHVIWFVVDERREALLAWLWHRAGPALALATLAAALALWRGALRFGPLLPQPLPARRSVAEQIRGTAAFIVEHDGQSLLAASREALDAAARRHVARYDRLTLPERASALGSRTGLATDALMQALDPQRQTPKGRTLADALALLETARRRLIHPT
jgi:hypothetical protein